MIKAVFIVHFC